MADPTSWDLLDEDCSVITDWVDVDNQNGVSQVNPAGQFEFDTNTAVNYNRARRTKDFGSCPNTFTVEIKLHHDALGTFANTDYFIFRCEQGDERLEVLFETGGLFVNDTDSGNIEVGTDLVKHGGSAEWQIWRILVTFTGTTGDGTCDIYLKDSTHDWDKVGPGVACSTEGSYTDGKVDIFQNGFTTNDRITHIDYIKIATGLYPVTTYLGYFSGYVFEQGDPVSRELCLHNRTTGGLITTTTSSGNGYYYLETASSGSHYIVCLDDDAGVEYNDLIIGSVFPTEIT